MNVKKATLLVTLITLPHILVQLKFTQAGNYLFKVTNMFESYKLIQQGFGTYTSYEVPTYIQVKLV